MGLVLRLLACFTGPIPCGLRQITLVSPVMQCEGRLDLEGGANCHYAEFPSANCR
ncbi:hypothetical protein ACLOJK_031172 [Asimina triloba]